jgi:polysaccharide biosynthesis protein PslH
MRQTPNGGPLRILWLSPYHAWPSNRGASVRFRNQLVEMARLGHELEVWVVGEETGTTAELDVKTRYFPPRTRATAWEKLASLLRGWPRDCWYSASPQLLRALKRLDPHRFDVVIANQSFMTAAVRALSRRSTPIVVDAHNVEADVLAQIARFNSGINRYKLQVEFLAMQRRERQAFRAADLIFAVSDEDAARVRSAAPAATVRVHPNTIDLTRVRFRSDQPGGSSTLLFVGTFAYPPNEDAAFWLCQDVLPLVRTTRPDVRVRLVGTGASASLNQLRGDHVDVVGEVTDMNAELARASIGVVPVRAGGGTRLKALEAMAAGVPVVGTSIGLEGLHVEHLRHAMIADTDREFSDAITRILGCPELAQSLSRQAKRLIDQQFDSRLAGPAIAADLRSLAASGRRR